MPNDKIHFDTSGKDEKLPLGPISGPSPGPTLEIEVAAPEIAVIKSKIIQMDDKMAWIEEFLIKTTDF